MKNMNHGGIVVEEELGLGGSSECQFHYHLMPEGKV
jgi:hypothetical protein